MDSDLLNFVSLDTLQRESYDHANLLKNGSHPPSLLQQFQAWQSWLYSPWNKNRNRFENWPPAHNFDARYAASAWARGECELFGVSLPRFHGRVYLSDNQTSFLDVRRIRLLSENPVAWYDKGPRDFDVPGKKTLQETLASGAYVSAIAGGLLERPARLADFHLIEADLGLAFGEKNFWGMPYLKHMRLGGGMCSQVCVMMAALLMWRYAKSIGGVADITLKARQMRDGTQSGSMKIGGLSQPEIIDSLPEGLQGWVELGKRVTDLSPDLPSRTTLPGPLGRLKTVLRSYVLSNIPVILCVDLDKLAGVKKDTQDDILNIQGHDLPHMFRDMLQSEGKTGSRHAVILGGCDLVCDRIEKTAYDFIIHDPATVSHLRCSIEQIFEARTEYPGLDDLMFIPIVPDTVNMSLGLRENGWLSLLDHAIDERDLGRKDEPPYITSEYRLANFQDLERTSNHRAETVLQGTMSSNSIQQVTDWGRENGLKWCWIEIQYLGTGKIHEIVVWNAEQREGAVNELKSFSPGNDPFEFSQRIPQDRHVTVHAAPAPPVNTDQFPVTPALISSFCTGTFDQCADVYRSLPSSVGVDLYCFMHHALKKFYDENVKLDKALQSIWSTYAGTSEFTHPTAFLEFLNPNIDDKGEAERRRPILERLRDDILRAFSGRKIVALSTYFPQITNKRKGDRNAAKSALVTVGWIARELILNNHPICSIEVVAGTRVEGLLPIAETGTEETIGYEARMISRAQGLERFSAELTDLLNEMNKFWPDDHRRCCDKPRVVLEFEPGDMYLAEASQLRQNSSGQVLSMLSEISKQTGWSVQINLDTAHAQLGGLELSDLSVLAKHIGYTHYAHTFPRSHASDVTANCFSESKQFVDKALTEILPFFSNGAISAELEVCVSRELLQDGVNQFLTSITNIPFRK